MNIQYPSDRTQHQIQYGSMQNGSIQDISYDPIFYNDSPQSDGYQHLNGDRGSIYCTTVPQEANIYLDNVLQSKITPATITNVLAKQHTITFTKTGYESYTQTVTVIKNQTVTVSATLSPLTGNITIITDPSGANIYLDGFLQEQLTSTTISNVPVGQHTIMITRAGYSSYTQTIEVLSNQTIIVSAILQPLLTAIDGGIVICATSEISTCPTTPMSCPTTVSPLNYINIVTAIDSIIYHSTIVRFTYLINDMVYHIDTNVDLIPGTNIVYAWDTNRTFPSNTLVTLTSVTFIHPPGDIGEIEECLIRGEYHNNENNHSYEECREEDHQKDNGHYDDRRHHHYQYEH